MGFIQLAGVPIIMPEMGSNSESYEAVYHSNYDSLYWVEHFGDPGLHGHAAMCQFVGDLAMRFTDSNFLPINVSQYSTKVAAWVANYSNDPAYQFANFSFINAQVNRFREAAMEFQFGVSEKQSLVRTQYPSVRPSQFTALANFNIGRVAQFIGRAARYLNNTAVFV